MRSLEHQGVTTIFGYPGGSIMPVFDALYDHQNILNHILVRHEHIHLIGVQTGTYSFTFDYSMKEFFMIAFFSTIGFS